MDTCVVTGAGGFLGSNVLLELLRGGYDVLACDIAKAPGRLVDAAEKLGRVTWVEMDVTEESAWQALPQLTYSGLIHAAAVTPPEDDPDPKRTAEVNLFGSINAADWALERGVPRLVLTSSSAVYRYTEPEGSLTEDLHVSPRFSYGWSKLAAEGFISVCREKTDLDCCAVRLPSMYGPWEHPTQSRENMSPVYHLVHAAACGEPLRVTGGDVARDWTYVGDAARGLIHLLNVEGGPEVLNLSTGEFVTLTEILQALVALKPDHSIRLVQSPPYDLKMTGTSGNQPMDTQRLNSTGYRAKTSLKEGLAEYLNWLQQ